MLWRVIVSAMKNSLFLRQTWKQQETIPVIVSFTEIISARISIATKRQDRLFV